MAGIGQFKRATLARWNDVNPILNEGELGLELVTNKFKMGDGLTHWMDLPYSNVGPQGDQGIPGPTGTGLSRTLSSTINMGNELQYVEKTITDTLIKSSSVIFIQVLGDEYLLQNVRCELMSIVDSVSYTLKAIAPEGASGIMNINILIF